MADFNNLQRSKERIAELLSHLNQRQTADEKVDMHIRNLQNSIKIIDDKMEEFQKNNDSGPANNGLISAGTY